MGVTEEFIVFDWLKSYFPYASIDEKNMPSVLHFCLMWSLFESRVCDRHASPGKMKSFTKELNSTKSLKHEVFDPYLLYFQERYLCNGKTNDRFDKLRIREDYREHVESVLKKEETKSVTIILALLIIVYRLRNNLFHGEKPVITLHDQNINFNVANSLLAKILDLHKENR
jgi:hypothetical protein